nr:uncharacterized protein LOC131126227 isoform X2 [Doryrhamphus excisus]XP_057924510.1 uncharacterized protein LOC131126227 isoform X2 [Doryrhamphus excisus]
MKLKMWFPGIVTMTMLADLLLVPVDMAIVQVQQWVVVGARPITERVLLNGDCLPRTEEFNSVLQSMSADSLPLILVSVSRTSLLQNQTVLRSRDCIMEGSDLQWTDCIFVDGIVYLSLDHNGNWTAHTPQAVALKAMWERAGRTSVVERLQLQDKCMNLMRKLKLSEERSEIPFLQLLIPILALLLFTGLAGISLIIANKSLRHNGGVIGSIIHYPKDMAKLNPGTKRHGYYTL